MNKVKIDGEEFEVDSDVASLIINISEERDNLKVRVNDIMALSIGWAYADCCAGLDLGKDPRQTEMSDALKRAKIDLDN